MEALTESQKFLLKMVKELGHSRARNLFGKIKIIEDCGHDMILIKSIIWDEKKTHKQNIKLYKKYESLRNILFAKKILTL